MFSSGSDCSPRHERRLARGVSGLGSSMAEGFESSGGVTIPAMSPVLPTSSSGLGEGMLVADSEPHRGSSTAAEGGFAEPHKTVPESEARGRGGGGRDSSASGSESGSGLENAGRGAHMGRQVQQQQRPIWNGLPLPAGPDHLAGVPDGGGEPLQGGSSGSGSDSRNGSSSSSSSPPGGRQRRGRPPASVEEPNAELSNKRRGGGHRRSKKREHVPTPRRRRVPGAWGEEGEEAAAANGEGDHQGSGYNFGSHSSTEYSGSNPASESGTAAAAAAAGQDGAAAAAVELPPPPPAPAPPAPEAPVDFSQVDLLSEFDSNTTWAGASAYSHATARTGGRGSVFETSSALSQYPSSQRSTTAAKLDSAAVWKHQPLVGRNGELNGVVSVTTASRRSRGRASPPHVRVPTGTPARRGARKGAKDKMSAAAAAAAAAAGGAGGGSEDSSKPRALPRPTSLSRRAAMSPHGVAMDAAMKIVEEQGARLGIVREEREDNAAGGGGGRGDRAKDAAYANQIAAPAMTSLEQRRQRAKAWAKSR